MEKAKKNALKSTCICTEGNPEDNNGNRNARDNFNTYFALSIPILNQRSVVSIFKELSLSSKLMPEESVK